MGRLKNGHKELLVWPNTRHIYLIDMITKFECDTRLCTVYRPSEVYILSQLQYILLYTRNQCNDEVTEIAVFFSFILLFECIYYSNP